MTLLQKRAKQMLPIVQAIAKGQLVEVRRWAGADWETISAYQIRPDLFRLRIVKPKRKAKGRNLAVVK